MRAFPTLAVAVLLASCASSGSDSTDSTSVTSTHSTSVSSTDVDLEVAESGTIFLLRDMGTNPDRPGPFLYPVAREGAADLEARIAALSTVTERERADGITTAVPSDTIVNSVEVKADVATIDLSASFASGGGSFSMAARLAQVIHTAIDAPDWINEVILRLDGAEVTTFSSEGLVLDQPLTLADAIDLQPGVLFEAPGAYAEVGTVVSVRGIALTTDGTFHLEVVDTEDTVLATLDQVRTDRPTGWGDFAVRLTLPQDLADGSQITVHVWADGPTGEAVNESVVPLTYVAG